MARNGAAHVHAIDIDQAAAANTLTNAFRNGVADRVSSAAVDLFPWEPEERYDVIVASLYQMPVDPFEQVSTHRRLDYWGRNLVDHLIALLPKALADDGVAYLMQLSIIGEQRSVAQLDALGYQSRVVDFAFFEFHELFDEKSDQIARVEALSDAYHLKLGDQDVGPMVGTVREPALRPATRSRPPRCGACRDNDGETRFRRASGPQDDPRPAGQAFAPPG